MRIKYNGPSGLVRFHRRKLQTGDELGSDQATDIELEYLAKRGDFEIIDGGASKKKPPKKKPAEAEE